MATQDTVTQLISAIRRVGRQVPGGGEVIAAVCMGHDYTQPGKPRIDWTDPDAKQALVSALVTDANAVLAALTDTEAELDETAAAAVALLALVAGQDVEPAEGSDGRDGRWRIARKVAPDRVISTVDEQARHTRKSPSSRRDGYRAHLVAEPETGLITDEALTMAAGPDNADAAVARTFLTDTDRTATSKDTAGEAGQAPAGGGGSARGEAAACPAGDTDTDTDTGAGDRAEGGIADEAREALRWYGDSAYGTGELREAIERAGDQAVIKPKPVAPAVAGGFTVDDFTVDEAAGVVTCPAGQTRPLSAGRSVTFGALCRECPLRARCTTSKTGRSLVLHEHDDLLRAARAGLGSRPRAARGLPPPPAEHRARRLPGREPGRAAGQAALPRHQQEPRLAQAAHRGAEPAQPDRSWPHPHGRSLGSGGPDHLTRPLLDHRSVPSPDRGWVSRSR